MILGLLCVIGGALFLELSTSLGKFEVEQRKESIYAMGFLTNVASWFFFGILILLRGRLAFDLASLPTFALRAGLEIVQIYVSLKAMELSSRSTNSFIRSSTIPLLLVIDIFFVHAPIGGWQIMGIAAIVLAILALSTNRGIERRGLAFVMLAAINAATTLSLYKYNISRFNSIEAEQFFMISILIAFLAISAWRRYGERPWTLLCTPALAGQSVMSGVGVVLVSAAFAFLPASVATAVERSGAVFFSILTGRVVFHEKHLATKLSACALIALGIVLIAMR